MRSIVAGILLLGVSSFAAAKLPDQARACEQSGAGAKNPHCNGITNIVSVPEPSTLGLMGLGLTILLLARRRKTRE